MLFRSLNDIAMIDRRLAGLPPFRDGKVYNNTKLITGTGANDYWERGSTSPSLILKDLATILHPELFPGDTLIYYRRLMER